MDKLAQYDSDDEGVESSSIAAKPLASINAAPDVALSSSSSLLKTATAGATRASTALALVTGANAASSAHQLALANTGDKLLYNPKYEDLYAPVAGPYNPSKSVVAQQFSNQAKHTAVGGLIDGSNITGFVEAYNMSDMLFQDQYREYYSASQSTGQKRELKRSKKRRLNDEADQSDEYVVVEDDSVAAAFGAEAFVDEEGSSATGAAEGETAAKRARPSEEAAGAAAATAVPVVERPTSIFHLDYERDYQGRTFISPPSHLKPLSASDTVSMSRCHVPKRLIHTWTGHTKGITSIEFFPKYGHLLLSSSNDSLIKIWDVMDHRRCIRTYQAHGSAVKKAHFDLDGRRFASCSYDNTVKLWDTETGKVLQTFTNGRASPNCVAFCPDQNHPDDILVGYSNKKILQWDIRTKEIAQQYERHLGGINSVTFINDGKQFVSTSDDKTVRVWDYGIAVEIKYIADPSMHSMPATSLNANGHWMLMQSLDNQLLAYETVPRFRQHKKKRFTGHIVAGYACQVGFSNDGQFVFSGDSEGNAWFWNWKTCKRVSSFKAHDNVCIDMKWHPIEASKVATCGWDGVINYWE